MHTNTQTLAGRSKGLEKPETLFCVWMVFLFRCALLGKRVKSSVRKAKRVGSCRQILIRKNGTVRTRCAINTRKGEKTELYILHILLWERTKQDHQRDDHPRHAPSHPGIINGPWGRKLRVVAIYGGYVLPEK